MSFGTLVINYPDKYLEATDLSEATVHLGSAYDNDVVLYDASVAPYHAQLLCDESGYQLLDLGTTAGINLAGARLNALTPTPLSVDTPFQLGAVSLVVRSPAFASTPNTKSPGRAAALVTSYPDGYSQTVDFVGGTVHLGSAYDNDVVLYDASVAPYHAQLLCDESGYQLLDLGTTAGINLAGARLNALTPTPLSVDTPFQLGAVSLVVRPLQSTSRSTVAAGASPRFYRRHRRSLLAGAGFILAGVVAGGIWLPWADAGTPSTATAEPNADARAAAMLALRSERVPVVSVPTEPSTSVTAAPVTPTAPTPTTPSVTIATSPPEPTAPTVRMFIVSTRGSPRLNLRSAPGQTAPVVGKLASGTTVRAVEGPVSADGVSWLRVEGEGLTGWSAQQWLSPVQ